jgi:hypothetical protein
MCGPTDGGDVDGDGASCTEATCADSCRAGGWSGGACLGTTCPCVGTPPDGGGDADAPDGVRDDGVADDAGGDDRGPEDAAAEEAEPLDVGDPCTVDDLVEQLVCGEGMKCAFTELIGTRPDPICDRAGARPVNLPCGAYSISDTCQAGLMCLNDGSGSRCRMLCRTDDDCGILGPRAGCLIQLNFSGTVVDGIKACTLDCDVLAGTGCATGQACRAQFVDSGGGVYTAYSDCTGVGSGTQLADCTAHSSADCAARYGCFTVTGATPPNECLYFCNMSLGGADCPAGTCNDIHDPAGRIGACL